ncbi:hypothetical protein, partial [uncultured Bilophila sp.]|uniref:hypothetical protein n=1 Tax=uncultured Bilophila sp. TaxID=529385 RepID=UPI00280B2F4F
LSEESFPFPKTHLLPFKDFRTYRTPFADFPRAQKVGAVSFFLLKMRDAQNLAAFEKTEGYSFAFPGFLQ